MAKETVALNRSMSSSSYKQNRMMERRSFFPSYENLAPIHGGLLQPSLPLIPFSSSSFNPSLFDHYMQQQLLIHNLQQQPPLLPLPASKPLHRSLPSRTRSLSRPPTTRETNNARSQSFTPKKPKSKVLEAKKINSMSRLGPDPKDLPKDVTKMMSSSSGKISVGVGENKDNFSSPIFLLAPPPSSLPLPRFTMKSAKGCKAEIGVGVDAGATDSICRLMRLP